MSPFSAARTHANRTPVAVRDMTLQEVGIHITLRRQLRIPQFLNHIPIVSSADALILVPELLRLVVAFIGIPCRIRFANARIPYRNYGNSFRWSYRRL